MSLTTEEEDASIKPKELVFLLAIAGRIDAQSRILAQKLDEDRYIYHFYAILDSLSSSFSMFKYFFEVFSPSNTPAAIHDFMTSPAGIATIAAETMFLVSFAFLASYLDGKKSTDKDKKDEWLDSVKYYIVELWPYFRHLMKGLKNAFKAWKSVIQIVGIFGVDLTYMLIPLGMILGVLAAMNRLYFCYVVEKRKVMMSSNWELFLKIQQESSWTSDEHAKYLKKIAQQDMSERICTYFSVILGGLIDGLYLYAGVMSLAILAPPAFIAMLVISAFYTLSCVISRVYEEYDYQLRLLARQTQCHLALTSRELETVYAALLALYEKVDQNEEDQLEIIRLKNEVDRLITDFDKLHQVLQKQITHSYLTAGLLGMKNGLFAYGVLAGFLFMTSSILTLGATAFPPALIIACIVAGLFLMLSVTVYTIHAHYQHLEQQKQKENEPYKQLVQMKKKIQSEEQDELLTADDLKKALNDGLQPEPSPQFALSKWLEFLRSFFSGLSKGKNYTTFLETPFHDLPQDHDHEHDTPLTTILNVASAALFSIVLALRALAREMGRSPLGQAKLDSSSPKPTKASGESSDSGNEAAPDSPPRKRPIINLLRHSIFTQRPAKPSTPRFIPNPISTVIPSENIVRDLR